MILKDIINDLKIGDILVCRCRIDGVYECCKKCGRIYMGEITSKFNSPPAADIKIMKNDCLQPIIFNADEIMYADLNTQIEFVI